MSERDSNNEWLLDTLNSIAAVSANGLRAGMQIAERNNAKRMQQLVHSLAWALKYVRLPDGVDPEEFAREYNEAQHLLETLVEV